AKLAAYQGTAILTARAVAVGLALGPIMILGSYVGKRVLDRLPERGFVAIIELVLVGAGVWVVIGRERALTFTVLYRPLPTYYLFSHAPPRHRAAPPQQGRLRRQSPEDRRR